MRPEGAEDAAQRAVAIMLVAGTLLLLISDVLFDAARYRHGTLIARSVDLVSVGSSKATVLRLAADLIDRVSGSCRSHQQSRAKLRTGTLAPRRQAFFAASMLWPLAAAAWSRSPS